MDRIGKWYDIRQFYQHQQISLIYADCHRIFVSLLYREVEQLVARWAHNPKVTGSSPVLATSA